MVPFNLASISGTLGYDLIFLLLGVGFGIALEISGFGDSRKLAAQFYFREMTVLKVMFTGIVVAAVLIFLASAFDLLDFSRVWVNPTYLAPGIVGGLIMGFGFIIGGFCPGTSLVAASTLKVDGIWFVSGVGFGVFLFGESVHSIEGFFQSTYMGRFTIPDWLGLPYGVVVVLLVLMALTMFWGAEFSEAYFGAGKSLKDIPLIPKSKPKMIAAGTLLLLALILAVKGQPTVEDRWGWIAKEGESQLQNRDIHIDSAEVVELKKDLSLLVNIIDLRGEADYNLFHLNGARRVPLEDASGPAFVRNLLSASDNTVVFLVSNGEDAATQAWKKLKAQGVMNLYIVAGGINGWLERYPLPDCVARKIGTPRGEEALNYVFRLAVGERNPSAHPYLPRREEPPSCALPAKGTTEPAESSTYFDSPSAGPELVKKVKLKKKTIAKGGCG